MKSTFKVLFYLKKGSEKKNGEVMIMARITIDGKLCQFSTKQSILPENWNIAAGKAKGKDAGKINALLEDIKASLNNIYHEQQRRDNYVTAEKVKNEFLGHSEKHETILNLFKKHNDDVKQLVGISKTIATYRKYEVTRRHLEADIGKVLGNALNVRLDFRKDVICIDGIRTQDGDYVDIGAPVADGHVVPVVVKTLIFNS